MTSGGTTEHNITSLLLSTTVHTAPRPSPPYHRLHASRCTLPYFPHPSLPARYHPHAHTKPWKNKNAQEAAHRGCSADGVQRGTLRKKAAECTARNSVCEKRPRKKKTEKQRAGRQRGQARRCRASSAAAGTRLSRRRHFPAARSWSNQSHKLFSRLTPIVAPDPTQLQSTPPHDQTAQPYPVMLGLALLPLHPGTSAHHQKKRRTVLSAAPPASSACDSVTKEETEGVRAQTDKQKTTPRRTRQPRQRHGGGGSYARCVSDRGRGGYSTQ